MQNNPVTAIQLGAGTICFDANWRLQLPSKEKERQHRPGPQKCKFSFSLACFADATGFWKSQLFKTTTSKILEPVGSLAFGVAKYISDLSFCCLKSPELEPVCLGMLAELQEKRSPKAKFCSREPASSANLSRERLGNPHTPGSLRTLPEPASSFNLARQVPQRKNQLGPRSAGFEALAHPLARPSLMRVSQGFRAAFGFYLFSSLLSIARERTQRI